MNQRGSSLFFGIILMMILSVIGINYIETRIDGLKDLKNKQSILLCAKSFNGELSQFITRINHINTALKTLTAGQVLTIFIPGFNIAAYKTTKAAIKALKMTQQILLFSFMKNKILGRYKSCQFSIGSTINPYRTNATKLVFKRNSFNETIKVKNKWKNKIIKGKYQVNITYTMRRKLKSKSKIKKANLFSRLLYSSPLFSSF